MKLKMYLLNKIQLAKEIRTTFGSKLRRGKEKHFYFQNYSEK